VKYNPVVTSFLYLAPKGSTLFIDSVKVDDAMSAYLAELGVAVAPYNSVKDFLAALPTDVKVLVDPSSTSDAFTTSLGERAVEAVTPIKLLKAVRNAVQIEGTRAAHVRDGVALVRSIMELERRLAAGDKVTEIEVCHILTRQRSLMEEYFDDSFGTIDGYKEHGAIVHYEPTPESDKTILPEGILLIDSGAQYFDGTTDITRTISLGNPTAEERRDFTLVLKGHIALATVVFPTGTRGVQLDVLARQFLWSEGKTYLHGTGHGVGHFLNVHEGPQSIRMNEVPTTIVPGMLTSNEPGLYVTGKYGIRCENLVLSVPAYETEYGSFLKFETVTLFPFDLNLLDLSIMTDAEIEWLNDYHKTVFEKLSPRLTPEEREWLAEKTRPVKK
jgi:Xaa-Pro aminopeptidase